MKEKKLNKNSSKIKIATVWWKDAYSHNEDVSSGDEVENSLICISSGILLERNEEAVKLAMDLFEEQAGQEYRSFRSIGVIPVEFVVKILVQEIEICDKVKELVRKKKKSVQIAGVGDKK